jgi:hypothetical protein
MTALLEFQRTMARAVMRPLSWRDNMKRGAADGIALVKPNSRLSSFERLEIYNRSYWYRVLQAFSDDFPGVRALLGARQFDRLRRRYLDDCPSESFTMRDLGKNLAAWMERNPALAGPHASIALDMAKLEWAEIESFDAAGHEPLDHDGIAALGPDSGLQLQPSLRLVEARHEVDTLLLKARESAKRTGGAPRAIAAKRIARAASATPVYLAIHRLELVVHYKRIDVEMFRLLKAVAGGASIADAVEIAYAESALTLEQCQQHVHDSFALFAALGWFRKPDQRPSEVPA